MVNLDCQVESAPLRDESLFYLFSPITRIKGLGDATAQALMRLLPSATALSGNSLPLVRDLLFHLPVNLVDRSFTCPLSQAPAGVIATFVVKIDAHYPPPPKFRNAKTPYKVICSNDTGTITLVFFHASNDYIKQSLPVGEQRVISGRVEHFDYRLQMTHPDIIAPVARLEEVKKPEPVYPLTIGLTSKRIGKYVEAALEKMPQLPEWIENHPNPLPQGEGELLSWKSALHQAHHPLTPGDLSPLSPARARLAYDEMLAGQLHLAMLRRNMQNQSGDVITGTGALTGKLLAALPFKLTQGQLEVLHDIHADLQSGHRMGRLLQGDVGSGKTIVALLAMLRAAEQSLQSALMVPTELIAQQHYDTIRRLTAGLGVNVALLTGSVKGKARQAILEGAADGSIAILIGTHALFQEQVAFHHLALAVIDEQHRFGVAQRMALTAKGNAPHLLHMTATPIPRSLTMTLYGDMDASTLREKPAERLPITTRVIPLSRYDDIMTRLKAVLDKGEKVYWICPLIEEGSGVMGLWGDGEHTSPSPHNPTTPPPDLPSAESRFTEFKARFGNLVGLVHGRMKSDRREAEMRRFAEGDTRLLVATTVVEVGVDVRDATIIVIEQAERFGLSQLHQLRGRVGRGDKPSSCVLLYSDSVLFPSPYRGEVGRGAPLGKPTIESPHPNPPPNGEGINPALARLSILRETEDGFAIAEADLRIRGGGDLLGNRQSGLQRFIFMDLLEHHQLLEHARNDAAGILQSDPNLTSPRGKALRLLLQLFQ